MYRKTRWLSAPSSWVRCVCILFFSFVSANSYSASVQLEVSEPLIIRNQDNVVIENLLIDASKDHDCALDIFGVANATIRNLEIRHANNGICAVDTPGLIIENVRLTSTSTPDEGPHCVHGVDECIKDKKNWANPDTRLGIKTVRAENAQFSRVAFKGQSGGFYINNSERTKVSNITCEDMHGPYPRGQCLQFNSSSHSELDNFYAKNWPNQSRGEDNINIYNSDFVTISNGFVDGNFSINGFGVKADTGSDNATVKNIDFTNTSVGALNVWSNDESRIGENFYAENIRVKNTQCYSRDGLEPSSGGLVLAMHPAAVNARFVNVQYFNHCRSVAVWCAPGASCRIVDSGSVDAREEDFDLPDPVNLIFPWEADKPTILDVQVR